MASRNNTHDLEIDDRPVDFSKQTVIDPVIEAVNNLDFSLYMDRNSFKDPIIAGMGFMNEQARLDQLLVNIYNSDNTHIDLRMAAGEALGYQINHTIAYHRMINHLKREEMIRTTLHSK